MRAHQTSFKQAPGTLMKSTVNPRSSVREDEQSIASTNGGDDNSRVRVVVRIRPLNEKEMSNNHKNILEGGHHHIVAWDPTCFEQANKPDMSILDSSCWSREFAFDRCLWSTDLKSPEYASQSDVFEEVGKPVLDWILGGFNCCVFAFGQTGAGKTWTMMGDIKSNDPNRYGLIPRICFSLFEALDSVSTGEGLESVMFSHMEIYNENVRDLLARPSFNPNNGLPVTEYLRVREHPSRGVFVANLTTIRVTSFEDLMSLVAIGDKNRTVGATNANMHSSRSHAIVTLTVIQRSRRAPKNGLPTSALQQKVGRVHLVDLAGSERVSFSGAVGTRLREASNINHSLSVLGDVIKCLGEKPKHGLMQKKVHIPYRNSTLTMVLKDSLGGNAHTVMLTAVSPSSSDYEETISTLKYTDRAKRVRMRVEANVTSGLLATDASAVELVPLLQAEVRKLREMLSAQQVEQARKGYMHSSQEERGLDDVYQSEVVREMRERVRDLEMQLAEREKLIESLEFIRREREYEKEQLEADRGTPPPPQSQSLSQPLSARNVRDRSDSYGREISDSRDRGRLSGDGYPALNGDFTGEDNKYFHIEVRDVAAEEDEEDLYNGGAHHRYSEGRMAQRHGYEPNHRGNGQSHVRGSIESYNAQVSPLSADSQSSWASKGDGRAANTTVEVRKSISQSLSANHLISNGVTRNDRSDARGGNGAHGTATQPSRSLPVVLLSDDAVDISLPRVINLNQDPLFSECLVYYIPRGKVIAGCKEGEVDIMLTGPDIVPKHCLFTHDPSSGEIRITAEEDALVFVNGDMLTSVNPSRVLKHWDRVALGRFHLFRYEASGMGGKKSKAPPSSSSSSERERERDRKSSGSVRSVKWEDQLSDHEKSALRESFSGGTSALRSSGKRDEVEQKENYTNTNANGSSGGVSGASGAGNSLGSPPGWEYAQEELMLKYDAIMGLRRPADSLPFVAEGGEKKHLAATASSSSPSSSSSSVVGVASHGTHSSVGATAMPSRPPLHTSPNSLPLPPPRAPVSAANDATSRFLQLDAANGSSGIYSQNNSRSNSPSVVAAPQMQTQSRSSSPPSYIAHLAPSTAKRVLLQRRRSSEPNLSVRLDAQSVNPFDLYDMNGQPKVPVSANVSSNTTAIGAQPRAHRYASADHDNEDDEIVVGDSAGSAVDERRLDKLPPSGMRADRSSSTPSPSFSVPSSTHLHGHLQGQGQGPGPGYGDSIALGGRGSSHSLTGNPEEKAISSGSFHDNYPHKAASLINPMPSTDSLASAVTTCSEATSTASYVRPPTGTAPEVKTSNMRVQGDKIYVGDAPASFEKEALALQEELAQMQRQLQERMQRYQVLTSIQFQS